jgi:hypothetical protein
MMTIKNPEAKWYVDLCKQFEEMARRFKIGEEAASELKVFILETARNQYLAGNRSGIRWAREQMSVSAR